MRQRLYYLGYVDYTSYFQENSIYNCNWAVIKEGYIIVNHLNGVICFYNIKNINVSLGTFKNLVLHLSDLLKAIDDHKKEKRIPDFEKFYNLNCSL
jgi:hypothetical protein